jgi:hypothetical protein
MLVYVVVAVQATCALASAAILNRSKRSGTGLLLGALLGPLGLAVALRRRAPWERELKRWERRAEEARKEQAWREWRGH